MTRGLRHRQQQVNEERMHEFQLAIPPPAPLPLPTANPLLASGARRQLASND